MACASPRAGFVSSMACQSPTTGTAAPCSPTATSACSKNAWISSGEAPPNFSSRAAPSSWALGNSAVARSPRFTSRTVQDAPVPLQADPVDPPDERHDRHPGEQPGEGDQQAGAGAGVGGEDQVDRAHQHQHADRDDQPAPHEHVEVQPGDVHEREQAGDHWFVSSSARASGPTAASRRGSSRRRRPRRPAPSCTSVRRRASGRSCTGPGHRSARPPRRPRRSRSPRRRTPGTGWRPGTCGRRRSATGPNAPIPLRSGPS